MKQFLCLFLAAILLCGSLCALAQDDDFVILEDDEDGDFATFDDDDGTVSFFDDTEDLVEELELVPYDYDHITVGNPTPLNGQFFTDLWGNATSDTDVRHLVTGYNLVTWDGELSLFRFDKSVVSDAVVRDDQAGNRTYLIPLYTDLYFSDGTPITAWSYAFTVLLQCSPIISELGGHPAVYDYLVGYEDYVSGAVPYISGLRVLSDNLLMVTVKAESLPYFYELSRLAFYPFPIHAIAPGCAVYDDGQGAYIANEGTEVDPLFTAGLLRSTILDPQSGFMTNPDPVSGPYRILSYDGVSATFEINPYYKGNEAGKKPRIKRLTYTVADNDDMIQKLSEGEFALLNKVAYAPAIAEGLRLCVENTQYTRALYPRIGLTYILFSPESALVQEQNVRQAIAYCFDKLQFVRNYVGSFGLDREALYGLGQWMTSAVSGTLEYPGELSEYASAAELAAYDKAVEEWDALSLDGVTLYDVDLEKAVVLLEEAGWTLGESGNAFDPETDTVRYKEINGELHALELTLGYQPRADVEQAFADYLAENLAQAGIRLICVPATFECLVEAHNDHAFESYDLLYLGDNFNISFDPALFFWNEDAAGETSEDSLRVVYDEMFALASDMDRTEPRDVLGYMQKWILFQERLTELLPLIPVYSNIYFDFYTRELDEYYIEEHVSWAKAIVPARMRSIREIDGKDTDSIEVELSYADGNGDLDLSSLVGSSAREAVDYTEGALSLFPKYVRDQVPAEYRTINEFVAGRIDAEIDEETTTIDLKYTFQTPYAEGETVYLLCGVPGKGNDVEWFVSEGVGLENGSVHVTLEKEEWEKLLGITFALAVVSK